MPSPSLNDFYPVLPCFTLFDPTTSPNLFFFNRTQLTDIEPERLYQCLTGRHFYYCPAGATACPAQAYTGCLGRESNLWRALNVTYDEEPEDPFKHFFEVKQGYECEDSAEGITMESQLDIREQVSAFCVVTQYFCPM